VEQRRTQSRGWHQHFLGFRPRFNCERIPVIPAWVVRANFDDPRKIPYLLIWKDEVYGGEIKDAVRLARAVWCGDECVELKRTDGSTTVLRTVWRTLPRNGGRTLFFHCFECNTRRRYVYGWEWNRFAGRSDAMRRAGWKCRSCAFLRYSSEGGYLRPAALRQLLGACGTLPRPQSWLPNVFTSIEDPALDVILSTV
jgi:hypothetical protein